MRWDNFVPVVIARTAKLYTRLAKVNENVTNFLTMTTYLK